MIFSDLIAVRSLLIALVISSWEFIYSITNCEAWEWVVSFVDCYNHQHRHSGIKFVTPHQRHSGHAVERCRHRADVYAKARQKTSASMEPIHPRLPPARGGVDQQATRRAAVGTGGTIG
jgi:hypothetical protein